MSDQDTTTDTKTTEEPQKTTITIAEKPTGDETKDDKTTITVAEKSGE